MQGEFESMVEKGKWVVLPYHVARQLPGLQISPPGVKVFRYRRLYWLGDYIFNTINDNNLPLLHLTSMQYGQAIDRLLK